MTGLTGNNILAGSSAQGEYRIEQSLRFDNSSYLSQTQTINNDRKKFIFSFWFKPTLEGQQWIFGSYVDANNFAGIYIDGTENFRFESTSGGVRNISLRSSRAFRDYGNWYHAFVRCDTTQTTPGANDIAIWINGEKITDFQTEDYPSQNYNTEVNQNGATHYIGQKGDSNRYYQGYLAEFYFIPGATGLSKSVSDFGETDVATGKWIPKKYTGGYTAAAFYLPFTDSSDLGKDYSDSSQDRNYTSNGFTANDQVLDSPTNNFATLNDLYTVSNSTIYGTLSEGSLKSGGVDDGWVASTQTLTGKKYWEVVVLGTPGNVYLGAALSAGGAESTIPKWRHTGATSGHTSNPTFNTFTLNDILMLCYDADNNRIYYGKNGTWENSADPSAGTGYLTPNETGEKIPWGRSQAAQPLCWNFGQDSSFAGNKTAQGNTDSNGRGDFYYSPPSGYLALCEDNLPNPSIALPGDYFNTVLYTGNGVVDTAITGVGFQPDWLWIKKRSAAADHQTVDAVRGHTQILETNNTDAELTTNNRVKSFDSDGFTVGGRTEVNNSGDTYVSWNWKADNTSGSSNTDGTITSTVSANPTAGFSIVKFVNASGTSQETVGHGLSQSPDVIISKNLDTNVNNWAVFHSSVCDTTSKFLQLNTTASITTYSTVWGASLPTASVFGVTGGGVAAASANVIAYCFHSVEGYSKFGSYTGNGSADGPFIYTGFRPAFFMIKNISSASYWLIYDNKRNIFNAVDRRLLPNTSDAEAQTTAIGDFLSNGIKIRMTALWENNSGDTHIYMAFAENPFKYSNAR